MAIDLNLTNWSIVLLLASFIVVPFLTPLLTAIIAGLVFRSDMVSAVAWGILFGVLAVPFGWALSRYWEDWPGFFVGLGVSAAGTTLFIWWWARRSQRNA